MMTPSISEVAIDEIHDKTQKILRPCPSTPNCLSKLYDIHYPLEEVRPAIITTLHQMKPISLTFDEKQDRWDAVFRVFFFKDDMQVKIEDQKPSTYLHIRSASRTGTYDFGVNKRRIKKFIKSLVAQLNPS